jgi:hypothetical protein
MPRKYLGNTNSKEIHEFNKMIDGCKLDAMREEYKFWLETEYDVKDFCKNKGYNGCIWCLTKYHTD